MVSELNEISGLAYSTSLNKLYAINDEKGKIYGLDIASGKIVNKIDFAKSDDYEGVTYSDSIIYVVESNGNIKVVDENLSQRQKEFDDRLSRHNDIEGIVYNPVHDNILLAAKGDSKVGENDKHFKSIFSMNKENGKVNTTPFLSINLREEIKKLTKKYTTDNAILNQSIASRVKSFAPSGIAIHPKSNDIYIVSARGKTFVGFEHERRDQSADIFKSTITCPTRGNMF